MRRILTSSAMPHRACPVCRVQGRLLEETSKEALVEYYRCDKCGRIWTHRKADPNSPPTLVTVKARDAGPVFVVGHRHRLSEGDRSDWFGHVV